MHNDPKELFLMIHDIRSQIFKMLWVAIFDYLIKMVLQNGEGRYIKSSKIQVKEKLSF